MAMLIINLLLVLGFIFCFFLLARLFLHRTALILVVRRWAQWIDDRVHVHQHFRVPQFNENGQSNMLYRKVYLYLNSLPSLEDSDFTNLFSGKKSNDILLYMDDHQIIRDTFLGATITWTNHVQTEGFQTGAAPSPTRNTINDQGTRSFLFEIKKKDKRRILRPYLQHIHTVAEDIEQRNKEIKLFFMKSGSGSGSGSGSTTTAQPIQGRWRSTPFTHPSTFDTLVMDSDLKKSIKSDLDTFLKSEQYYHKVGRVWKRSYLLYGPSGTGKSSFIAAMANYLSFDVYDVDLSRVSDDSDLKVLLLQITRKSIVVVEDLDFFLTSSNTGVTAPGMLNFMDGILNSCCGDEKIMVFTVNNKSKEEVDSGMLRPGRIDVHIHFPLCDFSCFKSLANNYLGVKEHKLFPQVEEMFESGATMSPSEIGELMLVHRSSPSRALKSVISALQWRSGGNNQQQRRSVGGVGGGASEEEGGVGVVGWKETAGGPGKELRKLYGLLGLKSSKKSGAGDQECGLIQR